MLLLLDSDVEFEWDDEKCASNLIKHGKGFEEARALWSDPRSVRVELRYPDEPRYLVTGVVEGSHWTAICTDRGPKVRIISFRRAHKREEELYEGDQG